MGYILPITQHTYINYHARLLEDEKSPYHISATYKVMFNKIQGDAHDQYKHNQPKVEHTSDIEEDEVINPKHQVTQSTRSDSYLIDKTIKANLTGKGNWVNQQI